MKLIEYSVILEYLVTFDAETKCYFIYSPVMSDTIYKVAETIMSLNPSTLITFVTDEERAKQLMNSPQCCRAIDDINGNIAD